MSAKRSSKVCWMVPVSTDVPAMNATLIITARAVSRKRTLCAASPLRVTFHIALRAELVHLVENRLRGRFADLVDDLAVGKEDDATRIRRRSRIVGHHHDRLTELEHRFAHEVEDLGTRLGIEVARGFVGE